MYVFVGVAGLESSIIQITRDNPFAGLVITSQSCAQDQTVGSVGGTGEEGNPELWDSVKVEQEWSQVRHGLDLEKWLRSSSSLRIGLNRCCSIHVFICFKFQIPLLGFLHSDVTCVDCVDCVV